LIRFYFLYGILTFLDFFDNLQIEKPVNELVALKFNSELSFQLSFSLLG